MKKTIKPPALFRKVYVEKKFHKKVLKKLYIPTDKLYVESFFTAFTDPKKGPCYKFNPETVLSKADSKRLARIAKQIKKQKGRFDFVGIGVSVACIAILVLSLTVFRNSIARFVLVTTLESTFGARVDIALVDVDLLDARFTLVDLEVANKKEPMQNLFGLGKMELYFDLLELSRGKLISNNVEVSGVTWNTARSISGALPPKKQKKINEKQARAKKEASSTKPNLVSAAIGTELNKLKSGISIDSGIGAVKDQFNPVAYFETQKESLLTPAIASRIQAEVPVLVGSWQTKSTEITKTVDTVIQDGSKVLKINVPGIKTVQEAKTALEEINNAVKTVEKTNSTVSTLAKDISADAKMVSTLSREAEQAIKNDASRVKDLAESVKSFDLADGGNLVSGIFETFTISTLGAYYPYMEKGLSLLKNIQTSNTKTKKQSLKAKSTVVSRLPGRDFNFGDDSSPRILFKNIHLSALDSASSLSADARVQNVTNDADRLGSPLIFNGEGKFKALKFALDGTVDLRLGASEIVDTAVSGRGLSLSLGDSDSEKIPGLPSIKGSLELAGKISVAADDTLRISGEGHVYDAVVKVKPFEPSILYSAYSGVFSRVKSIDADLLATISPDAGVKIKVKTDLDSILASALKEEAAAQIEKFKADVIKAGNAYLEEQKEIYSAEIARVTDVLDRANLSVKNFENYQETIEIKKKEVEARINSLVGDTAAAAKKAIQDIADKAAKEAEAAKQAAEKAAKEAAEKAAKEAAEKAALELKKKLPKF